MELICGDVLEELRKLPDRSVDLVLTDPPYNIGVTTQRDNRKKVCEWDKIQNYADWMLEWLKECQRILKENGVLYFWHNDMAQIAELLERIKHETDFELISFCIWDKGEAYRARSWLNRDPEGDTALRSWFNRCEYCLHFFRSPKSADGSWRHTGLDKINSNPECYKSIKEWYKNELKRLGLTKEDVARKCTEATGKKPFMLRHYFNDSQFAIPTRKIFETVYEPLGFRYECNRVRGYEALRQEHEALRQEHEALRQGYEALRNYHRCDRAHCNVWRVKPISSVGRRHTCQKPMEILERIIRTSCRPDGVVLDAFMGSGSTGVACVHTGRDFIGIERDCDTFREAKSWIEGEAGQMRWEV